MTDYQSEEDGLTRLVESVKEYERQYNETISDTPIKSILNTYACPPQFIKATITTEDGNTYTGVLYLVEEQQENG